MRDALRHCATDGLEAIEPNLVGIYEEIGKLGIPVRVHAPAATIAPVLAPLSVWQQIVLEERRHHTQVVKTPT